MPSEAFLITITVIDRCFSYQSPIEKQWTICEKMVEHFPQKSKDCYRPGINPKIKARIGNKETDEYIMGTVKGTSKETSKGTAKGNHGNAFTLKCQDKKTPNGAVKGTL